MAITLTNTTASETLTYDHIFMVRVDIEQVQTPDDTEQPTYIIDVLYKLYAVDSSNVRHYNNKIYSINVPDYLTEALAKYGLGDTRYLDSIKSIEIAIAQLISDKSVHGGTGVV